MIETTDQALECLEAWVGDRGQTFPSERKQAALLVTRALRQARQALAEMPPLRTAPVAGDEELRRLAEELYGEPALGIYAGLRRVAEEARRQERERIEGIVREAAKPRPGWCPRSPRDAAEQTCDEILRRIKGEER